MSKDRTLSGATRVDLGVIALKEYSAFPKLQVYRSLSIRLFVFISRTLIRGSYPSAEKQLVYSTAPADWAPFVYIQFKCETALFNLKIGPYQVLLFWARVDLGVMVMKEYSHFPKLHFYLSLTTRLFNVISRTHIGEQALPHCRDAVSVFLDSFCTSCGYVTQKWENT